MGKSLPKPENEANYCPPPRYSRITPNRVNGMPDPDPAGLRLLRGIHYSL